MVWLWVGFLALILSLLVLDLGLLNRKLHEISVREAIGWTFFWVFLSLVFGVCIYFMYEHHWMGIGKEIGHELDGKQAALQYLTGYIIEKSLSLDNIFVIALIFSYFNVPPKYQHRTLFWGILGALILRGAMIAAGSALIHRFEWMIYVFGGLLIITALKLLFDKGEKIDPDKNPLVRLARRIYPVTKDFHGEKFFMKLHGKRAITPLFLVLLVVESSDVLFAIDSIPAIFAVTRDPFIVFTSNVFAILGLRSLYFALAAAMGMFRFLKFSLVFILAFVGVKMLISHYINIPILISLGVIAVILATGIGASLMWPEKIQEQEHH
jgi:tellurite resistance protein TerC